MVTGNRKFIKHFQILHSVGKNCSIFVKWGEETKKFTASKNVFQGVRRCVSEHWRELEAHRLSPRKDKRVLDSFFHYQYVFFFMQTIREQHEAETGKFFSCFMMFHV